MPGYINKFLSRYGHQQPSNTQLSLHQNSPISYGAKTQKPADTYSRPPLDVDGVKRVQGILVALLWYRRVVTNKLLVSLRVIVSQQTATTDSTADAIHQLLDYVATYSNYGITYCVSNMVLAGHFDASYLNKTRAHIYAGAHILPSEDEPMPRHNVTHPHHLLYYQACHVISHQS